MPAHVATPSSHPTAGAALGSWIRKTRMEQGITQRALADRSGISRSYLCDIERGRGTQPSVSTLDKLSLALGASREELMRAAGMLDTTATQRPSEHERRLLAVFRDLSEHGQESALRFVRFLHAEEHHWVQAQMARDLFGANGEADGERVVDMRPAGPLLFDLPQRERSH